MARKMKTMDGNHAAAHVSYAYYRCCSYLSDHTVICYGRSYVDEWATEGRTNIFGQTVTGYRDAV